MNDNNIVKEPYISPEMEIIEFENEDIITNSNETIDIY